MDASKKEQLEQKGALVLLLVFALVLGSTLKNMGIIGGKKKKAQVEDLKELAHVVDDLPGAMKGRRTEAIIESFQESLVVTEETEESGLELELPGYAYKALKERDPLRPALYPALYEVVERIEAAVRTPSGSREPLGSPRRQQPQAVQPPELVQLQGILWDGDNPQVILQGEVYGLGDLLAGSARIVAITKQGVTVNKEGRFFRMGVARGGRSEEETLSWKLVAAPTLDVDFDKGSSMAAESISLDPEDFLLGMPNRAPLLEGR